VLTDVERVVDTVGVLDGGRLLLQAPLEELKERTKRLVFSLPGEGVPGPAVVDGELVRERRGKDVLVVTAAYTPQLEAGLRNTGYLTAVEHLNLEDIFVALVDSNKGTPTEEAA
jgi:ABC-2 type transport system ATP-binding protein